MRLENFIFLLGFFKFSSFLCIEFIQRMIRKDDFAVVFFTLKKPLINLDLQIVVFFSIIIISF